MLKRSGKKLIQAVAALLICGAVGSSPSTSFATFEPEIYYLIYYNSRSDRDGAHGNGWTHSIQIDYTANRLVSVTDQTTGRTITFSYNAQSLITVIDKALAGNFIENSGWRNPVGKNRLFSRRDAKGRDIRVNGIPADSSANMHGAAERGTFF